GQGKQDAQQGILQLHHVTSFQRRLTPGCGASSCNAYCEAPVPVPVLGAAPLPDSVPIPLPLSAGGVVTPPLVPLSMVLLPLVVPEVPVPVPVAGSLVSGTVTSSAGAAGCSVVGGGGVTSRSASSSGPQPTSIKA